MNSYISPLPSVAWCSEIPRNLVLLGSTGSIGRNALRVVQEQPEQFRVLALAGAKNITLLAEQANTFRPAYLAVLTDELADGLCALLPQGYAPQIYVGQEGYAALAALPEAQCVLSAQVGAAGLAATLAAVDAGKVVALANKESLVLAGEFIRKRCYETGASILPVDSEHNAIFQAFQGHDPATLRRILLTASGGPFRGKTREFLQNVTAKDALKHPNWSMGAKITIDSATLMNKGLEVIEACHLYGVGTETIEVVVHPQSIVHSLVEYSDGSQIAQLGTPDMRIAIAYCLGWPRLLKTGVEPLDLVRAGNLQFEAPDEQTFSCLALAKYAFAKQKGLPVVMNAANEVAVALFLAGKIGFLDIAACIESTMHEHEAWLTAHAQDADAIFWTTPFSEQPATLTSATLLQAIQKLDARSREKAQEFAK